MLPENILSVTEVHIKDINKENVTHAKKII